MKYRRLRGDMILVYELLKEGESSSSRYFFNLSDITFTRGHSKKLSMQHCSTNTKKFSFSNRIVINWNNLPEHVVSARDTNIFKNLLDDTLIHTADIDEHLDSVDKVLQATWRLT